MNPEMAQARLGKLTASRAAVIMGGLDTAGLDSYIKELAFARVYGDDGEEGYKSAHMDRGTTMEPLALDWYSFDQDCELIPGGECIGHPTIAYVAASPDARRSDRVIEAKCPGAKAWMETKRNGLVPSQYRWQCRWQMWVCGVRLCDFVTWHALAGGLIVPISVEDSEIERMAERAAVIETKVQEWVDILQDRRQL